MNWFSHLTGSKKDKLQKERTEEVSRIVHIKKSEYTAKMLRLQMQAKKVHEINQEAFRESRKLMELADDVASKVAIVTGGLDDGS